jgi:ABC-type hemin transport system ATPase subunit
MSNPHPSPTIAPLHSIRIQGFRGIRDLELSLDPHVTVFFGANAAGKTTIHDALAIGLGAIVKRVPQVKGRGFLLPGDLRVPFRDYAPRPAPVTVPPRISLRTERAGVPWPFAHVELQSASGLTWGVTAWRSAADRQRRQPLLAKPKTGARDLDEVVDALVFEALEASPGQPTRPIPLVAAYGNGRAVVDVPLRERDFRAEFGRLTAFEQSLAATTRFRTVFEWFRVMEDEERRQREKRRDFEYRLPELEWVCQAVGNAGLRCRNPRVETRPIRMLVDFEHTDGVLQALDLRALSDGYRTHFALVVDIARRMVQLNPTDDLQDPERGTNSAAVILIDEVDLHLDPTWQARVVQGLRQAFPNAQFVLTTHSEQVLGSVAASCVRRLVWQDGTIVAESVPFAQGATGERILIDLMGAPERVPGPVTERLRDYLARVDKGQGHDPEAVALREDLNGALPGDPRLHQADLEMQRRDLLKRIGGGDA